MPTSFALLQNYPNPFNPTTTFTLDIPYSSFVTIKVYNLLGQEVATIANEQLNTGRYERTFDARSMSSGVYFYRLTADGFTDVKKFVILR